MSKPLSDTMWAIKGRWQDTGEEFLYTGTFFTRQEAILAHCQARPYESRDWQKKYRRGDRCIRVRVTELGRGGAS